MIYYNEKGEIISEESIDLAHGYLIDKDIEHHDEIPAVTHEETREFPGGSIKYTVIDTPAVPPYDEVISKTYYYTGATEDEKIAAQVMYTALLTDTLLVEESTEEVVDNV